MTLTDLLGLTAFLFANAAVAGDENYMWAEHGRLEAEAAIARLHTMQRRYANLQTLYTDLVRRRLAESTPMIIRKEINHDRRN